MTNKMLALVFVVVLMSVLPMAVSADLGANTLCPINPNEISISDLARGPFIEAVWGLWCDQAWSFVWWDLDYYVYTLDDVYYAHGESLRADALSGNIGMLQTRAFEALTIINEQAINSLTDGELMAIAHAAYTPTNVRRISRHARAIMRQASPFMANNNNEE